ncbi:MAG: dTDP-4-dehydrorhamnose 3,5-epimerase [Candidatus Omnitrophota bacterium]
MIFSETKLRGAFIIDLEKKVDERGFFSRIFCQQEFEAHGLNAVLAQGNAAFSPKRGTLRGMHFQKAPFQEEKLIRCGRGAIYDVIIDLRKDSETCGQWVGAELTADNHRMIYVPKDFAHGYLTLLEDTEVLYFMTQFYRPESESGVRYDDPAFQIEWPASVPLSIVSEKDKNWPDFSLAQVGPGSLPKEKMVGGREAALLKSGFCPRKEDL